MALATLAACLGLLAIAPGAYAYTCGTTLDDFDRADSPTLGTKWTQQAPTMSVAGQRATNPNATAGLATFNAFAATEVCVDVSTNGTGVQYGGVVLRYGALTTNLFIKVQQNAGAGFSQGYFYVGNNGAATPTPSSVALVPFASGRLHVFVVGNRVTLDIDTNFDGTPEQSFGSDYPAGAGTGTGVGLASYGGARLDNFRQPTPGSNPIPAVPVTGVKGDDKTAGKPALSGFGLSSTTFRAAGSGPSISRAKVGTTVEFTLSKASSVSFSVERKTKGRRVGGKCVKAKRSNRKKRSCTRYVKVSGSFKVAGKAGDNKAKFSGRVGGRKLSRGTYRLNARATDTAKQKSALKRTGFKIVR